MFLSDSPFPVTKFLFKTTEDNIQGFCTLAPAGPRWGFLLLSYISPEVGEHNVWQAITFYAGPAGAHKSISKKYCNFSKNVYTISNYKEVSYEREKD
jgi:hypothetical protein